jgi:hypothetical protein
MKPLTSYVVAGLIICGIASNAGAQAPTPTQLAAPTPGPALPDNLFVSAQTPIGGDSTSRGAGLEWLHPLSTTSALQFGGSVGTSKGGWFSYGRAGGMLRVFSATLAGAVDLGGGGEGNSDFSYTRARGDLTVPTGYKPLFAQVEVDHIRLAGNVTTGFRIGGMYQVTPRLSVRANAHGYMSRYEAVYENPTEIIHESGYVLNPAGSVRADYGTVKWKTLAGLFFSKRPALTATNVNLAPAMHATRTTFVGMQVRAGAQDLVGVVDVSEQPSGTVTTLMVSVKVALQ